MKRTQPAFHTVELEHAEKPNYRSIEGYAVWWLLSFLRWCGVEWARQARDEFTQVHGTRLMHPPGRPPSAGLVLHEKMHVLQRRSNILWRTRWLLSRRARCWWEAEAYAVMVAWGYLTLDRAEYLLTRRTYWPLFGAPSYARQMLDDAVGDYMEMSVG